MTATIVNESADSLTIQVVIPFNRSMLGAEDSIQNALNQAGTLASHNFQRAIRHGWLTDNNWSDYSNQQRNSTEGVPDSLWCDDGVKACLPECQGRKNMNVP